MEEPLLSSLHRNIESTLIKKPRADHPGVTVMREEWLIDVQDWMPECRHDDDVTAESTNQQIVNDNEHSPHVRVMMS